MVDWGFSWAVVITGLVVVFCVLVLLVFVCYIMGKIFTAINNRKNSSSGTASEVVTAKPDGGAVIQMVQGGIGDEVIAAITAAVAAIMSEDGVKRPFAIKSVTRSRGARSAWSEAGIRENTRPF